MTTIIDSWIKIDQLDVTCFIISLFTAQRVSNVSTSIYRSSRHKDTTPPQPNHTVTPTHIEPEQYNTWNKSTISRELLKMDVLTFKTCWAVNSEIIKQGTSSWSIFIQLSRWCTVQINIRLLQDVSKLKGHNQAEYLTEHTKGQTITLLNWDFFKNFVFHRMFTLLLWQN